MAGLAVQNFVSAAVGMAVAIALVRGFARRRTNDLGNFWVDLVRGTIRILLPISFIAAIVLIVGGAIQNFHLHDQVVNTLAGGQQTIPAARSPARRPSRNSAPTAAASTTPTRRTRSRTRPRGRTGSRSSCCWSSASRCRAPSVAWSAARSRATRSSRSWRPWPSSAWRHDVVPAAGPRHRPDRDRRGDGRRRTAVRRVQLGGLRRRDDADLHRLRSTRSTTPTPASAA